MGTPYIGATHLIASLARFWAKGRHAGSVRGQPIYPGGPSLHLLPYLVRPPSFPVPSAVTLTGHPLVYVEQHNRVVGVLHRVLGILHRVLGVAHRCTQDLGREWESEEVTHRNFPGPNTRRPPMKRGPERGTNTTGTATAGTERRPLPATPRNPVRTRREG